jgi:hypothetical protein
MTIVVEAGKPSVEARGRGPWTPIDAEALARLEVIGKELDRWIFPEVQDRGRVVPKRSAALSKPLGTMENDNVQRSEGTPAPGGSWQGSRAQAQGRTPPPRGPRAPGAGTPLLGQQLRPWLEREVAGVTEAYPEAQVWEMPTGAWLKVTSELLPGLGLRAQFYIAIQLEPYPWYLAWGFWSNHDWIGPRHTNFPDGSICAFDRNDINAWLMGEPIVDLLDMYSVWALRQLHLRVSGRWPGPQAVPFAYERLTEFGDDELCGCGVSRDKTYGRCCKPRDLKFAPLTAALRLYLFTLGKMNRMPPREVLAFSGGFYGPPPLDSVFPPHKKAGAA